MKPGCSATATSTRNVERKQNVKNARKSLHVLQPAARDKENLVGPGRNMPHSDKDIVKHLKEDNEKSQLTKKKKVVNKGVQTDPEKETVPVEDLTSDEPSEKYWKVLAEKRRVALEDALKENETLCKKIEILEQEKSVCEAMLEETKALVETFKEIIEESESSSARDE